MNLSAPPAGPGNSRGLDGMLTPNLRVVTTEDWLILVESDTTRRSLPDYRHRPRSRAEHAGTTRRRDPAKTPRSG